MRSLLVILVLSIISVNSFAGEQNDSDFREKYYQCLEEKDTLNGQIASLNDALRNVETIDSISDIVPLTFTSRQRGWAEQAAKKKCVFELGGKIYYRNDTRRLKCTTGKMKYKGRNVNSYTCSLVCLIK